MLFIYLRVQYIFTFIVGIKADSMAIWCAFDMDEYRGKKVPRMWRNLELDSVMGLYHINSRRESNLGELMAPIMRSLHRPSATSVLSSRSGSSNILERITTTELPPLKNKRCRIMQGSKGTRQWQIN